MSRKGKRTETAETAETETKTRDSDTDRATDRAEETERGGKRERV